MVLQHWKCMKRIKFKKQIYCPKRGALSLMLTGPLFLLQSNGAAGINPTGHLIRGRHHLIHRDADCV